ncbi:hypothetical protein ACJX0J_023055, partial [Zea mays]
MGLFSHKLAQQTATSRLGSGSKIDFWHFDRIFAFPLLSLLILFAGWLTLIFPIYSETHWVFPVFG